MLNQINVKGFHVALAMILLIGVGSCDSKSKCDCSRETVCITIINASGLLVENVILTQGVPTDSTGRLEIDGKSCLSFMGSGESSFSLTAILSNGNSVASIEEYAEGGYEFVGTVTLEEIKTEQKEGY